MAGLKIGIVGGGVCGLVTATELAGPNCHIELFERGDGPGSQSCSWWAGGMLAPFCERESAEPIVEQLGQTAVHWWQHHTTSFRKLGSLVVALGRDHSELSRFARLTHGHEAVDSHRINTLEPELEGRFQRGLWFSQEAHINPRQAMGELVDSLQRQDVRIHYRNSVEPNELVSDFDWVIDCRGMAARHQQPDLRGVKGEMLIIRAPEVQLNRPIRLLHPRIPLYVVPRGDGFYMIGATMIESSERERISVRSILELLNSTYALQPRFGEAEILEIGVDVRPAYADNLPRLRRNGNVISLNGLYRHGFLLSPALATAAARAINDDDFSTEFCDANNA